MKKQIIGFAIIALLFSCNEDEITEDKTQKQQENAEEVLEDTDTTFYKTFHFKTFYHLVKKPISIDTFKNRFSKQGVQTYPLEGYDKDIYFVIKSDVTAYSYYRIEVEVGQVLVNFDNPTSDDVREDYIQNINMYPLDENKDFVTLDQPIEHYTSVFDMIKNTLQEVDEDYTTAFRIISLWGNGEKEYDTFIQDLHFDDGIALWGKTFDEIIISKNPSNDKNVPIVQAEYYLIGLIGNLPYYSKYRILIKANLPEDMPDLIFN